MKVSVIIPVYNVMHYLERCVQSVLRQTYKDLEIILVDDGSEDNSGELCDQLALSDQRILVIHQENQGLSGARNTGISKATGEYILFLDSDDEWILCDGLEKLIQVGHDKDLIIFRTTDIWTNGHQKKRKAYDVGMIDGVSNAQEVFAYLVKTQQLHISACSVMVRRSILIEHKIYFPLRLISEDLFWSLHLWQHVKTVKVVNLYFYGYFHREGSITTSPSIRIYESYDRIFTYWKDQCNTGCQNAAAIRSYLADIWVSRGYAYYQLKAGDKKTALNILRQHIDLLRYAYTPKSQHVAKMTQWLGLKTTVYFLGWYWQLRNKIKR